MRKLEFSQNTINIRRNLVAVSSVAIFIIWAGMTPPDFTFIVNFENVEQYKFYIGILLINVYLLLHFFINIMSDFKDKFFQYLDKEINHTFSEEGFIDKLVGESFEETIREESEWNYLKYIYLFEIIIPSALAISSICRISYVLIMTGSYFCEIPT